MPWKMKIYFVYIKNFPEVINPVNDFRTLNKNYVRILDSSLSWLCF